MTEHPRAELSALLDGELEPQHAAQLERHLRECTECTRELAIMRELGGAMRTMSARRRTVWDGVHRRITRPAGWVLVVIGFAVWAGLALLRWWRAELTLDWLAATGVAAGLVLIFISLGYEQYRDWQETRYKDVQR
jgi:anti-sigma factor RsiW